MGQSPVAFIKVGTFCWPFLALGIVRAHILYSIRWFFRRRTLKYFYLFVLLYNPPRAESSPVVPLNSLSSNPLEFLQYPYYLLRYCKFWILIFLNVWVFDGKNLLIFIEHKFCPLNPDPLEFLGYLKPFLKYKGLNFRMFDSAPRSVL